MNDAKQEIPQDDLPSKIGKMLEETRIEKKLSIADVADTLKLRVAQVQLIEKGKFNQLSGDVFTRGFIRNYARVLDMSEQILPLLDQALPCASQNTHKSTPHKHQFGDAQSNKRHFPGWLKLLLVLAVLGVCFYYWQQQSQIQNKKQEDAQSVIAVAPSTQLSSDNIKVVPMSEKESAIVIEEAKEEKKEVKEAVKEPVPAVVSQSSKQQATEQVQQNHVVSDTQATKNTTQHQDDALSVSIKYRSYLTIKDSNGDILINQLVPGGSEHQFSGKPPYQVRIGYALGSSIEFNQQKIDLTKYMDGKTATLTIPEKP